MTEKARSRSSDRDTIIRYLALWLIVVVAVVLVWRSGLAPVICLSAATR